MAFSFFVRYTLPARRCFSSVAVNESGSILKVHIENKTEREYSSLWLRHNCQCGDCYDSLSSTMRVHPSQLSEDIRIKKADVHGNKIFGYHSQSSASPTAHNSCGICVWSGTILTKLIYIIHALKQA